MCGPLEFVTGGDHFPPTVQTRDLARMKKLPDEIQILGLRPHTAASIEGVSASAQMQNQGL